MQPQGGMNQASDPRPSESWYTFARGASKRQDWTGGIPSRALSSWPAARLEGRERETEISSGRREMRTMWLAASLPAIRALPSANFLVCGCQVAVTEAERLVWA